MLTKGIDISHYDPQVDWIKAKSDGVQFVYIKCTQGSGFVDPLCATHGHNAKSADVKIGYYHFANPETEPVAQANFFVSQLAKLPAYDMIPVLDIETNKSNLGPLAMETWIIAFNGILNKTGHKLMIYSYQPFLEQFLPPNHTLGNLPLWLAQYRNVTAPSVPKGWNGVDLWQYSQTGVVNGVSAKTVDMDKAFTDRFFINAII